MKLVVKQEGRGPNGLVAYDGEGNEIKFVQRVVLELSRNGIRADVYTISLDNAPEARSTFDSITYEGPITTKFQPPLIAD